MMDFIYSIPSFLLFLIISALCILISFIATKYAYHRVPLKIRYEQNPGVVCISALLGIIYAILVGFIILYELNNYNKADEAETAEAKAMFAIYRVADVLPEPSATKIRNLAIDYAKNVIVNEWPTMANRKPVNNTGVTIINEISEEIRSFKNVRIAHPITIQALNQLSLTNNLLFDDHQQRVDKIHSSISANIWFVLLLGTVLIMGINCILGMELRLHLFCITSLSLMISGIIYLIITLDHPYRGDFSIQPTTFISTMEYIKLKTP